MPNESADLYDLSGLNCPLPALKTRRKMRELQIGQRLWVKTTDPMAVIDIPAFCAEAGHHLVQTEQIESGHKFLIEKQA